MEPLSGKNILITGAGSGIGRLMAHYLADEKANVALVDINEQAVKSVTREISSRNVCASYYLCNIADSEAVAQTADRIRRDFGAVDILVNNAGTVVGKSFFDITLEEMQRTMNVNFWGHLFFTKAFIGPDGHLKIPHLWPGQYRLLQRSDRHADAFGICRQ